MAAALKIIREALELLPTEREQVLRALLDSLDEPGEDAGHAAAWDAEIERRVRDDDGDTDMLPDGRDALRRVRADVLGR